MEERKVMYPKIKTKLCEGKGALGGKEAKTILGWETEGKSEWGPDYLLKNSAGNKVRCNNNLSNRPFVPSNMDRLKQEILRGNWYLNGENRIIGKYGSVLNGQHTLIGLVLGIEEWTANKEDHPYWKTEPTINTSIIFGIEETDEVVNTVDTPKPRTLADVFYRSDLLRGKDDKARKSIAKILEYAVKTLWHRTGFVEAFNPGLKATHTELVRFALDHPKICKCAEHIYEENDENRIGVVLRPGYAAGILYLMGCSATNPKKYRTDDPTEKSLDWSLWDKACEFFVDLPGEKLDSIRTVLQKIVNEENDGLNIRLALVVKAWNLYAKDKSVMQKDLQLQFDTDEQGWKTLTECPSVGGIDYADPHEATASKEKIEKETKQLRKDKQDKPTPSGRKSAKAKPAKATKPKTSSSSPQEKKTEKPKKRFKKGPEQYIGKTVWVAVADGDDYQAKVLSATDKVAKVRVGQGHQGAGNLKTVSLRKLSKDQPDPRLDSPAPA